MAAVNAATYRPAGPGFPNQVEIQRFTYDFANDAGAYADSVRLAQFSKAGTIVWGYAKVLTTCTSSGSATVIIGTTSDTDCIMDISAGAVANLVANFIPVAADQVVPSHFAADDYLILDIATADLTAGKIEVVIGMLP